MRRGWRGNVALPQPCGFRVAPAPGTTMGVVGLALQDIEIEWNWRVNRRNYARVR